MKTKPLRMRRKAVAVAKKLLAMKKLPVELVRHKFGTIINGRAAVSSGVPIRCSGCALTALAIARNPKRFDRLIRKSLFGNDGESVSCNIIDRILAPDFKSAEMRDIITYFDDSDRGKQSPRRILNTILRRIIKADGVFDLDAGQR